jgi:hypothetical protein
MVAGGERRATRVHRQIWMTIAMMMKIKFDPFIVLGLPYVLWQPPASPAQACPAASDGDWNHALRATAHRFLPASDGLNTA